MSEKINHIDKLAYYNARMLNIAYSHFFCALNPDKCQTSAHVLVGTGETRVGTLGWHKERF